MNKGTRKFVWGLILIILGANTTQEINYNDFWHLYNIFICILGWSILLSGVKTVDKSMENE